MSSESSATDNPPGTRSTRDRLLDAAIVIAGTLGPEKVTYRSVAAEAGQAHGLVRFYFGDRETMLTLALERAAVQDVEEAQLLAPDLESFAANLVGTITSGQPRQLTQFDFLLRAVRGAGPVEPVIALYDRYIEQVAGTLENLSIPDPSGRIAALLFAALDGLVLQHNIYPDSERTEEILDELRRLLSLLQERST